MAGCYCQIAMRFASLLILIVLFEAPPVVAQTFLAQQCVAFGEAQYRKLDGSIDRIAALEFPPPILEKMDARAGSQAVAAALSFRGRLTYRNRQPLETQFICLLDGTDKPLFFYALPVPTTRPAPTPFGRGPSAGPPPASVTALTPHAAQRAPEPPRQPLPANALRLRGLVRDLGGKLQFSPCDGAPLPLEDRSAGRELSRALRELTAGQEGRPMFVEFFGGRDAGPGAGISVLEVRRAAVETAGCRERFDQREWIGTGSEPFWRLEITGRDMLLNVLGGTAPVRVSHGGPLRQGGTVAYAAMEGGEFTVLIDERRCVDSMSGSLFAYSVEIRSEGQSYAGCIAHNPAMPAP
jgi:uncharacterized membrane protein